MIEYITSSFLYSVAKDLLGFLRGGRRRLSASEVVALRQKWKPLFEARVWENYRTKLRCDVIIRDMKRFDNYPDLHDKKGISPWFRAGLVGTYHRGVLIGLRWTMLTQHKPDVWRFTNYTVGEEGDINALLIGCIPYEHIDNTDWDGDEFYDYPHIYCFFLNKKEPYEKVAFYTETRPANRPPFYTEVATYTQVKRTSRKVGIRSCI